MNVCRYERANVLAVFTVTMLLVLGGLAVAKHRSVFPFCHWTKLTVLLNVTALISIAWRGWLNLLLYSREFISLYLSHTCTLSLPFSNWCLTLSFAFPFCFFLLLHLIFLSLSLTHTHTHTFSRDNLLQGVLVGAIVHMLVHLGIDNKPLTHTSEGKSLSVWDNCSYSVGSTIQIENLVQFWQCKPRTWLAMFFTIASVFSFYM